MTWSYHGATTGGSVHLCPSPLRETMDIVSILWGHPLLCVSTASRHHAKINEFKVNFGVFN